MNIKQLKSKVDGLAKNKASLEAKRDAAIKALEDKKAELKKDWDAKIGAIAAEIEQYSKAIREQEKLEEMLEKARKAADALTGKSADDGNNYQ